jgi:hypothetical protein
MRSSRHSKPRLGRLGWIWVWGAFVVYFALEIARLS